MLTTIPYIKSFTFSKHKKRVKNQKCTQVKPFILLVLYYLQIQFFLNIYLTSHRHIHIAIDKI